MRLGARARKEALMAVLGLVLTLTDDPFLRDDLLLTLRRDPFIDTGQLHGQRLPVVIAAENALALEQQCQRLLMMPGVRQMEVVDRPASASAA